MMAQSRRQDCVTGSSTHAEIVAASTNSNDILWARGFLDEIGYRVVMATPTRLMVDAKNVLTLVNNLVSSKQTNRTFTNGVAQAKMMTRKGIGSVVLVIISNTTVSNL